MKLLVLLLSTACSDPPGGDGPSDRDDSAPWWEDDPDDADGDGFSAADGDCDDADPAVHPGVASDGCDGRDEDCDGAIDEDFAGDAFEPNDAAATELGAMDTEDEILVWGYLHPHSDVDRYAVEVEDDDWSWFSLEAWLYDVPSDADYSLAIEWTGHGTVAEADDYGLGGSECADWGGTAFEDDSGRYEIVVRSTSGAGCGFPYTLQILTGGW